MNKPVFIRLHPSQLVHVVFSGSLSLQVPLVRTSRLIANLLVPQIVGMKPTWGGELRSFLYLGASQPSGSSGFCFSPPDRKGLLDFK